MAAKVAGLAGAVCAASGMAGAFVGDGGRVHVLRAFVAGGPPVVTTYPAVPGGRKVLALSADGPSALLDNGEVWTIAPADTAWRRVGGFGDDALLA